MTDSGRQRLPDARATGRALLVYTRPFNGGRAVRADAKVALTNNGVVTLQKSGYLMVRPVIAGRGA